MLNRASFPQVGHFSQTPRARLHPRWHRRPPASQHRREEHPAPFFPRANAVGYLPTSRLRRQTIVNPQSVDHVVGTALEGEAEALVTEAERLWMLCSQSLHSRVAEATWKTWFESIIPVALDDGALVLAVPSSLVRE